MNQFDLIKQINEDQKFLSFLETRCNEILKDDAASLYENAQALLGKVTAQIAAGQDPGSKDLNLVNILAGLSILSDPTNRSAYGLDAIKTSKILDLVGKGRNATSYVANIGARSPATVERIKDQLAKLPNMEANEKRTLVAKLNKLRLAFTQLRGKAISKQKPVSSLTATSVQPA